MMAFAGAVPAAAQGVFGEAEVIDGDTMMVGGLRIDLAGIDAPELRQQCRRGDRRIDCGIVARAQLMDLTAGAKVVCDVNPYGQPAPAWCEAGGYDLSTNMIYTGWAVVPEGSAELKATEARAREAGRGLWSYEFVEPWRWRRGRRLPRD